MISKLKKLQCKRYFLFCVVVPFLFSCTKLDNYDEPNATVKGRLVDANTNTPFVGGAYIELIETTWDPGSGQKVIPINLAIKPFGYGMESTNGCFLNTRIFDATYNITPIGAFFPANTISGKQVSGEVDLGDIKVTPVLYIDNFTVTPIGDLKVKITYTINRPSTGTSTPKVQLSTCAISDNPYMGVNSAVTPISKDWSKTPDANIIGIEQVEELSVRKGGIYYVNVTATAYDDNVNTMKYANVTEIVKITVN